MIDALGNQKAARTEAGESGDELVGPLDGLARLGDGTTAEPDEAGAGAAFSIAPARRSWTTIWRVGFETPEPIA